MYIIMTHCLTVTVQYYNFSADLHECSETQTTASKFTVSSACGARVNFVFPLFCRYMTTKQSKLSLSLINYRRLHVGRVTSPSCVCLELCHRPPGGTRIGVRLAPFLE